jgi:hypothetical protein
MVRCAERDGSGINGRGRGSRLQAVMTIRLGAALAAMLALGACVGSPAEGPFEFFDAVTNDPLRGRQPPPGLDGVGYPNLASVPPLPVRGAASTREELTRALGDARIQSQGPLVAGAAIPPPPTGSDSPVPLNPPAPPRLASAPRIAPGTGLPVPAPGTAPDAPGAVPADPGMAPALPPAEMMAPAPPPAEMMAPPPPAPRL